MENRSKILTAKLETLVPPLADIVGVVSESLKKNYEEVYADISECPDFTQPPYLMTGKTIGDSLRIAEVGGASNLYPDPKGNVFYNLKDICEVCELSDAFVFGPGGGPRHIIGTNCEMVADATFEKPQEKVAVKMGVVTEKAEKGHEMVITDKPELCLMANLGLCSSNVPVNVLHIRARKRTGELNFPESVRQAIANHYPESLVSCAGIFIVKNSRVKIHVMPDFPAKPFASTKEVDDWLRYFEIGAPIICASVIHSKDVDNYKLRLEHTHCYNGFEAGHYYTDTNPETVEYEGYFALAKAVYRIDRA